MASFGRMTTDELLASIKARSSVPISQKAFQNADLIRFMNEEIDNVIVPLILSTKEEFYVRTETVEAVTGSSPKRYKIPYRAIGGRIRDVYFQNSSSSWAPMSRIQPEDVSDYQYGITSSNSDILYYLEGDHIVLLTSSAPTGSLKLSYYMKPNDLVESDQVAIITSIDTISTPGSTILSFSDGIPSNILITATVDFIEDRPNHRILSYDLTPSNINLDADTITLLNEDIPSELVVGDHVANAGESKVPQIPSDLHAILAQAVSCRIMEALGDYEGLGAANKKLQEMLQNALQIIDSRTEGSPQKIHNSSSLLRLSKNKISKRFGF